MDFDTKIEKVMEELKIKQNKFNDKAKEYNDIENKTKKDIFKFDRLQMKLQLAMVKIKKDFLDISSRKPESLELHDLLDQRNEKNNIEKIDSVLFHHMPTFNTIDITKMEIANILIQTYLELDYKKVEVVKKVKLLLEAETNKLTANPTLNPNSEFYIKLNNEFKEKTDSEREDLNMDSRSFIIIRYKKERDKIIEMVKDDLRDRSPKIEMIYSMGM